jgi:hypothetical protein
MNTTRLIEAYLDGSLEKEKVEEIKARAEMDAEFADLIRLHKEINDSIQDNELNSLRQELRRISVSKEYSIYRVSFPLKRIIQIAAAFLFVIIVSAVVIKRVFPGYSGSAVFDTYYVKYEPDVITRSDNLIKNSLENAQLLYQTGNYTECVRILDNMVSNDKQNYLLLFYRGLTKIELQQPEEAINDFLKIPPDWNNPYSIHRNWYLALCLIETGQAGKADPLLKRLSIGDGFYSERAKKILDKIRI